MRPLGVWSSRSFLSCRQAPPKVWCLWCGSLASLFSMAWLADGMGSCGPALLWHGSLYLFLTVASSVVAHLSGDLWGCDLGLQQEASAWPGSPVVLSLQHWSSSGGPGCDPALSQACPLWSGLASGDCSVCLRVRYCWGREQTLYRAGRSGHGRRRLLALNVHRGVQVSAYLLTAIDGLL